MKHLIIILKSGHAIEYHNLGIEVINDLLKDLKDYRERNIRFWYIHDMNDKCIASFDIDDISTAYAFSS